MNYDIDNIAGAGTGWKEGVGYIVAGIVMLIIIHFIPC